jgi:rubrerythrin
MEANVESELYACEVCRQVFKDSTKPTQCPRCQSSRIFNADVEQLTLRQLRQIASQLNLSRHRRCRYHHSGLIRQTIPTVEEVKQKEIERKELLKQGYCPHCKTPVVLLMLDCPRCKRPYETEN